MIHGFRKKSLAKRVEYVVQQYKEKKAKPSTVWDSQKSQANCTIPEDQATRRAGARCTNDVLSGEIPCEPNAEYAECDEGLQTFSTNHSNEYRKTVGVCDGFGLNPSRIHTDKT